MELGGFTIRSMGLISRLKGVCLIKLVLIFRLLAMNEKCILTI